MLNGSVVCARSTMMKGTLISDAQAERSIVAVPPPVGMSIILQVVAASPPALLSESSSSVLPVTMKLPAGNDLDRIVTGDPSVPAVYSTSPPVAEKPSAAPFAPLAPLTPFAPLAPLVPFAPFFPAGPAVFQLSLLSPFLHFGFLL